MKIEIERSKRHKFGIARKMSVFIDGKNVASLKVGERVEVEVNDPELIWVKMDWCRSEKLEINNSRNNLFVCGEENLFWAMLATFFYPVKVFSLKRIGA